MHIHTYYTDGGTGPKWCWASVRSHHLLNSVTYEVHSSALELDLGLRNHDCGFTVSSMALAQPVGKRAQHTLAGADGGSWP